SICALGDSNYPKFCAFGKDLDQRLESLGAQRRHSRTDCDVDFEEPFAAWLDQALGALGNNPSSAPRASSSPFESTAEKNITTPKYSRTNPFPAPLLTNKRLNAPGSSKDTRHFEFALAGSGLTYEAGDALGVIPTNCPDLVDEILAALKCSG